MNELIDLSNLISDYESIRYPSRSRWMCYAWDDFFHTIPKSAVAINVRDFCLELARRFPGEEYKKGCSEYYSEEGFIILKDLSKVMILGEVETSEKLRVLRSKHFDVK